MAIKKQRQPQLRPYLFDLTLLGPDRPYFGRLQIKMIMTSYVNVVRMHVRESRAQALG